MLRCQTKSIPTVVHLNTHCMCTASTSHHLVLIGSDDNNIHDPVQNVPNASWLHPLKCAGLAAGSEVLAADLLLGQVPQTANLCDSRTEMGHHPNRTRSSRRGARRNIKYRDT